jgi:hypothetical protein
VHRKRDSAVRHQQAVYNSQRHAGSGLSSNSPQKSPARRESSTPRSHKKTRGVPGEHHAEVREDDDGLAGSLRTRAANLDPLEAAVDIFDG